VKFGSHRRLHHWFLPLSWNARHELDDIFKRVKSLEQVINVSFLAESSYCGLCAHAHGLQAVGAVMFGVIKAHQDKSVSKGKTSEAGSEGKTSKSGSKGKTGKSVGGKGTNEPKEATGSGVI